MPSVECSAPCAHRSYNKYRRKKDGTYELSKFPGAAGPRGTCQHGTMIKIGYSGNVNLQLIQTKCLSYEHWDTLTEANKK